MIWGDAIGPEKEEEMEDSLEQKVEIINKNSTFGFFVYEITILKSKTISKSPVTTTKISEDFYFLKRLINYFLDLPLAAYKEKS